MKEIHLPPILFPVQWTYNIVRWSLGYYTCEECGVVKNVMSSRKETTYAYSYNSIGRYIDYKTVCKECYKSKIN